jgi:hypothetical protein
MDDEPLFFVFMPSLVSILAGREQDKGSPLTPAEVLEIRDGGTCVMLPRSEAMKVFEERGYDDIDPESAWEEWQEVRTTLSEDESSA